MDSSAATDRLLEALVPVLARYWAEGYAQGHEDGYQAGVEWDEEEYGDRHPGQAYELDTDEVEREIRHELFRERGMSWIKDALDTP